MAAETKAPKRRWYQVRWTTIGYLILAAAGLYLAGFVCVVGMYFWNLGEPPSDETPPSVRTPNGVHLLPLTEQVSPSRTTVTPPPPPPR